MKLRDIAHARSGDKGDISNISVIAYRQEDFNLLRQAVTPGPLLGRMTSTMRWLILLPAGPGALAGGWLGEHVSLRASLAFAGLGALLVVAMAWRFSLLRGVLTLPRPDNPDDALGAEAAVPTPWDDAR